MARVGAACFVAVFLIRIHIHHYTSEVNTLFPADLLPLGQKSISHHQTVGIVPHEFLLEEDGVQLELTIIDTPGFGDQLDRTEG